MVFAVATAPKTDLQCSYRDRATTRLQHPIPGLRLGHLVKLYHDTPITKLASAMTAKTPRLRRGQACHTLLALGQFSG